MTISPRLVIQLPKQFEPNYFIVGLNVYECYPEVNVTGYRRQNQSDLTKFSTKKNSQITYWITKPLGNMEFVGTNLHTVFRINLGPAIGPPISDPSKDYAIYFFPYYGWEVEDYPSKVGPEFKPSTKSFGDHQLATLVKRLDTQRQNGFFESEIEYLIPLYKDPATPPSTSTPQTDLMS